MKTTTLALVGGLAFLGLQGCAEDGTDTAIRESAADMAQDVVQTESAAAVTAAAAEDGLEYLMGPLNAEDILRIGDSDMLLVSGMNADVSGIGDNGHLYLVDPSARSFSELFPGDNPALAHDTERFDICPGPINASNISVHGLSLKETATAGVYDVYSTGHGAREAIEIFSLDMRAEPAVTWIGCVPMDPDVMMNSVTILEDGGLLATQFLNWNEGAMEAVQAGEITGAVFEWHPGGEVTMLAGTELSGANGILYDENNEQLFVAAYGAGGVLRFDLSDSILRSAIASLDMHVDNLRYTRRGTILAAGGKNGGGWAVYELDPESMAAELLFEAGPDVAMQGISVAEEVGDEIWVGTYGGDRLGIITP